VKAAGVGDVTFTVNVCPGFTTVLPEGDVIWRVGWL
jgi:hypothetical protein